MSTRSVAEQAISPNEERNVMKKVSSRLLPFLLLCYIFAFLDRVNLGFAKSHMQADLGFTEVAFGFAAGIFFIGYALFEMPSNLLLTRIGARKTLTRIMVLWGLASASTALVQNETHLNVVRFILGIFEAGFAPGVIFYLGYWYSKKWMAGAMSIYLLAGPIGSAFGAMISGFIIDSTDGMGGLAGWKWMFIIQGVPTVILGIIAWRLLVDRPADARWLNDREKFVVAELIARDDASMEKTTTFRQAMTQSKIYVMSLGYFAVMCGIYAFGFWLPSILAENGVEGTWSLSVLTTLPFLLAIVAMVGFGRLSDRLGERKKLSISMALLAAVSLAVAAAFNTEFLVSYTALVLGVIGVWTSFSIFWSVPSEHYSGVAAAGAIAFINTIGILGGFVAPYLVGWIIELTGSSQMALYAMAALLVVGAVAFMSLRWKVEERIEIPKVSAHVG